MTVSSHGFIKRKEIWGIASSVRGSAKMASALRFIADVKQPFTINELPGTLSKEEKLSLIASLLHQKVLLLE